MSFSELMNAAFPVETDLFSLELVSVGERPDGGFAATLRLFDKERGEIKEQEVVVVDAEHREDPRLDAYVRGWREALL
jgi:hypothetical protein